MVKRYLSLWLILMAAALAGCGSAPAETAAPKPTETFRATATQPANPVAA